MNTNFKIKNEKDRTNYFQWISFIFESLKLGNLLENIIM